MCVLFLFPNLIPIYVLKTRPRTKSCKAQILRSKFIDEIIGRVAGFMLLIFRTLPQTPVTFVLLLTPSWFRMQILAILSCDSLPTGAVLQVGSAAWRHSPAGASGTAQA